MASSNIKLFDENKGNMLSDTEFSTSNQRMNGVQAGVASSKLQNKAMYQVSLVAYAIAQVMMQNGKNANDTDAVSAFVANLSGTMLQKVYDIATTAEAQAGVATGKWMSPALVKAAIDTLAAKAQNILSDNTKALYGLSSGAVPDDVFAWVGRYAEHWWEKRTVNFTDSKVDISSAQPLLVAGQPLYYGNSVAYDGQKLIILNEQSIVLSSVSQTTLAQIANLAPCYVRSLATQNKVLYLPTGTTAGNSNTSTIYAPSSDVAYCSASSSVKVQDVSVSSITYGEWQTMFSANRSDYPDSGVVNGYEYRYLGVPFENLPTAPKISNGAYTGTGTYGKDNPNSLTFDFEPKIVFLYMGYNELLGSNTMTFFTSAQTYYSNNMMFPEALTTTYKNNMGFALMNGTSYGKKSSDGKKIFWYHTSSEIEQCNKSGETYRYIAIG